MCRSIVRSLLVSVVSPIVVLAFAACGEGVIAPSGPSYAISDGAHSGNGHFYFLPPMVSSPDPAGAFDGSLSPEVQVCVWNGTACTTTLALFSMQAGYGSESIRVSETDEHYIVNWHTAEILDDHPLGPDEVYRVRVLVDGRELGFADLAVVRSGRDLRKVDSDEWVPLKHGRVLPIKFRIEEGALDGTPAPVMTASAGAHHSCAVDSEGRAYCWGANGNGELGTGTAGGSFDTPQPVAGGLTWRSVQASNSHTCGLTTEGLMYCWGSNSFGQLGIGGSDFTAHPAPEPVTGGHTFRSLASLGSGESFSTCGVATSADMYCWGLNLQGELGIDAFTFSEPTPRLVTGGHAFAGPAAMARHVTCALEVSGDILCWGANEFGQLGRGGGASGPQPAPAAVAGGHTFQTVTVGATAACGIDADRSAWCWGRNLQGELGTGTFGAGVSTPQLVAGGHAFASVSGGWVFACGVDAEGVGLCWGQNQFGQLGRGLASAAEPMPGVVAGGHVFQTVEPGYRHACGLGTTGETYCWGVGSLGQLGHGSTASTPTPVFAMDLDPASSP